MERQSWSLRFRIQENNKILMQNPVTKIAGDHKELSLRHELVGLHIHLLAFAVGVGVGILALAGGLLFIRVGTNLG